MKPLAAITAAFVLTLMLSGCDILSLRPIAIGDDVIKSNKYVGTWHERVRASELADYRKYAIEKGGDTSIQANVVKPPVYKFGLDDSGYLITKTSFEEINDHWSFTSSSFKMVLTQINGQYWASISQSTENLPPRSSRIGMHSFLIEGNGIARVDFEADSMKLRFLDYDWFKNAITKNRLRIDHELVGNGDSPQIILTASTEQLRSLMGKIARVEDAFEEEELVIYKKK